MLFRIEHEGTLELQCDIWCCHIMGRAAGTFALLFVLSVNRSGIVESGSQK